MAERASTARAASTGEEASLPVLTLVCERENPTHRRTQRGPGVALELPERKDTTGSVTEAVTVRAVGGPAEDLAEKDASNDVTRVIGVRPEDEVAVCVLEGN